MESCPALVGFCRHVLECRSRDEGSEAAKVHPGNWQSVFSCVLKNPISAQNLN